MRPNGRQVRQYKLRCSHLIVVVLHRRFMRKKITLNKMCKGYFYIDNRYRGNQQVTGTAFNLYRTKTLSVYIILLLLT